MRKIVLVVTAATCAALAGLITARAIRRQPPSFPPYTITSRVEDHTADGVKLVGTETRWMSHTGEMHLTKEFADGERDEVYGNPARGVYILKRGTLFEFGPPYARNGKSMADWRKSPSYIRDDTLLGVPVVVLQTQKAATPDGLPWSEIWLAPSLGDIYLRQEIHEPGLVRVVEATNIERGEPTHAIPPIPEMPVDRRVVEARQKNVRP